MGAYEMGMRHSSIIIIINLNRLKPHILHAVHTADTSTYVDLLQSTISCTRTLVFFCTHIKELKRAAEHSSNDASRLWHPTAARIQDPRRAQTPAAHAPSTCTRLSSR